MSTTPTKRPAGVVKNGAARGTMMADVTSAEDVREEERCPSLLAATDSSSRPIGCSVSIFSMLPNKAPSSVTNSHVKHRCTLNAEILFEI